MHWRILCYILHTRDNTDAPHNKKTMAIMEQEIKGKVK